MVPCFLFLRIFSHLLVCLLCLVARLRVVVSGVYLQLSLYPGCKSRARFDGICISFIYSVHYSQYICIGSNIGVFIIRNHTSAPFSCDLSPSPGCHRIVRPSSDRFGFAWFSFLSGQKRKCRRGPVVAPATAATRAPRGCVSVPLPRSPSENILSNTTERSTSAKREYWVFRLTRGSESFRSVLTSEMCKRQRRRDSLQRAQIAEYDRRLAWPWQNIRHNNSSNCQCGGGTHRNETQLGMPVSTSPLVTEHTSEGQDMLSTARVARFRWTPDTEEGRERTHWYSLAT